MFVIRAISWNHTFDIKIIFGLKWKCIQVYGGKKKSISRLHSTPAKINRTEVKILQNNKKKMQFFTKVTELQINSFFCFLMPFVLQDILYTCSSSTSTHDRLCQWENNILNYIEKKKHSKSKSKKR